MKFFCLVIFPKIGFFRSNKAPLTPKFQNRTFNTRHTLDVSVDLLYNDRDSKDLKETR